MLDNGNWVVVAAAVLWNALDVAAGGESVIAPAEEARAVEEAEEEAAAAAIM